VALPLLGRSFKPRIIEEPIDARLERWREKKPGVHCVGLKTLRAIVRYMLAHPDAKDTLEGVVTWWLRRDPTDKQRRDIKRAIDHLVKLGWVTTRRIPGRRLIYGVDRRRVSVMKAYLQAQNGCGRH
jgi:hypothetical protein